MALYQQCDVNYQLDGVSHTGSMHIEQEDSDTGARYRAIIETSPLHGTYGGYADTVELALDFLNLAMQAEGADNIVFSCRTTPQ